MGTTKSTVFNQRQNELAQMAKALGHPARIAILEVLLKKQSCICGDIVDELPLSQATISQHLKELKEVGLIKGDISGRKICYCIDQENWSKAALMISGLFDKFIVPENCC